MTLRTFLILLMSLQASSGAAPQLFREKAFTAASFAAAVNHFVSVGEDAAVQELPGLALDDSADLQRGFSANERIGWMCRVLFEPKGKDPLRPPAFGGLNLPYHTMPDKNWPLYPVALSGSSCFVLSEGYELDGHAEDPTHYIDYSRQAGVFRKKPVTVPTKTQALKDAASLRQSAAWKAIKWKDQGENWSYMMDEEWTWKFIQNQAESIR
jgi:hypothetical protein